MWEGRGEGEREREDRLKNREQDRGKRITDKTKE